jgi:hypothetical protein
MKIQSKSTRFLKTIHPAIGSALPVDYGKPWGRFSPMSVITGLALCIGLSSCVASYDSPGHTQIAVYSPGYRVTSLPGGYRSEIISGSTYYYHDGYYYRPSSGGYIVVDAPRTSRYYSEYDRRHHATQSGRRAETKGNNRNNQRYEEAGSLTRLPHGYREVKHRGASYYQVGDRYYQRRNDVYVVVSRPN